MSRKNGELKAKLLKKAEALIDEILTNRKAPGEATLADIEQAVLVVGQEFERTLTARVGARKRLLRKFRAPSWWVK